MLKRPGRRRFAPGSRSSTRAQPRPFPGRRHAAESMRRLDVARVLEYLEQALEETEAAARWYAERSPRAALAFSEEIDAAAVAIARLPEAYPPFDHGTRRFLLRSFHSALYTASKRIG